MPTTSLQRLNVAWRWLALIAVLVVAATLAAGHSDGGHQTALTTANDGGLISGQGNGHAVATKGAAPIAHPRLVVKGTSPGDLAPGFTRDVTVKVRDASKRAVVVTRVWLTVHNASADCTANRNITTTQYALADGAHPHYRIKPGHTVSITLQITMLDLKDSGSTTTGTFVSGNQDACEGASFPLSYHATGTQG